MEEEILNLDDACSFLGIKRRTMYKLLKCGNIPAIKIGGQWRFSRAAIMDLFHQQSQPNKESQPV